ncbi:MAG: hypothetical protein ACQEWF_01800 [Bacillota bacterium]
MRKKSSINPYKQAKLLELIMDCILGVPGAIEEEFTHTDSRKEVNIA